MKKSPVRFAWVKRTVWFVGFLLCANPAAAGEPEKSTSATPVDNASESSESESSGLDAADLASVDMNFQDADIRDFISYVSEVTGTNFIIDPHVKGRITVEAPNKVPVNEVLGFFQSVLEVHRYTTVKAGDMVKIVPSATAPRKSVETAIAEKAGTPEDKVVTKLIHLNYLSPDDAKRLLSPLLSKSGAIVSHPLSGALIITDYHPNIERQQKLIAALDVPTAREGASVAGDPIVVKVIRLEHANAETLASVLRPLLTRDGRITAYAPTNTLIIRERKTIAEQLVRVIKGDGAP